MNLVGKVKNFVGEKMGDVPKPEADVTDVDVKNVTISDGVTYLAKVSVKNPYDVSIPISDVKYTLKCAKRDIVSGAVPDPGSLKANETTLLEVDVKVPHSVLMSLMKDVAGDWDLDYELQIELIVDLPVVGNFTIPVSHNGEMKLPTWRDMMGMGSMATA